MEHYEITTETKEVKKLVKTTCDVCGERMDERGYYMDDVTIRHEMGQDYPGDRNVCTFSPDLCSGCFTLHIIPLLKSLGVDVKYK